MQNLLYALYLDDIEILLLYKSFNLHIFPNAYQDDTLKHIYHISFALIVRIIYFTITLNYKKGPLLALSDSHKDLQGFCWWVLIHGNLSLRNSTILFH